MIDLTQIAQRLVNSRDLVIDVETTGLDWRHDQIIGYVLTFSPNPRDSIYLPVRHGGGGNLDPDIVESMLRFALNKQTLHTIGHNYLFDLMFMGKHGLELTGPLEDTMINAYLIDEHQPSFSLDACCKRMKVQEKKGDQLYVHLAGRFGGTATRRAQMGNLHRLAGDDPIAVDYAIGDGTSTWQLWEAQRLILRDQQLENIWRIECRVIRPLYRMMRRGVRVDEERLHQVRGIVSRLLVEAHGKLPPNFNDRSPNDVEKYLTDAGITDWPMTQPTPRFPDGQPSFTKEWLTSHKPGRRIIDAREYRHLLDSFFTPLVERHLYKGRVHTTFNQTMGERLGTRTGRLSSSDPNMQQVHKRNHKMGSLYRSIFIPDPGMLWGSADYSQIEPSLLAHYSGCRVLVKGYTSTPRIDAHSAVAKAAGIDRESGKRLNQALITGAGMRKAASMLGKPMHEALKMVNDYFAAMPEIKTLQRQAAAVYSQRGYVKSLLGRRARLEDHRFAYKAVNRLLQCGNADIIKKAMADVDDHLEIRGGNVHMLLNIHDDICYQYAPENRAIYGEAMEIMCDYGPGKSVPLVVPIVVDHKEGHSWAEATYGIDIVSDVFKSVGAAYELHGG